MKERVECIAIEYLSMRKLCAKWVRKLTNRQKEKRIDDCEECLKLFNRNKTEFFRRYETVSRVDLEAYFYNLFYLNLMTVIIVVLPPYIE